MVSSNSRQLIVRAGRGDRAALDELFEREALRLRRLLRLQAGHQLLARAEVDDLVQEAYLEAVRRFDQYTYQGPDSFFRWLARIAHNRLNNLRRAETAGKRGAGRNRRIAGPKTGALTGEPTEESLAVPAPGPRTLTVSGEQVVQFEAALANLSDADREVILLARVEGLPLAEVAERMGRTRNAVALLLSRALRKLGKVVR